MKKYIIGILIAILIIGAIVTTVIIINNNDDVVETAELTTIQLNEVTRSVFYAPQYVAIANRIF